MASLYKVPAFLLRGLTQFTRGGFDRHAQSFHPDDIPPSLRGRGFVVTGANSGIGFATADGLARLGATVHLVCRNEDRGRAALQKLQTAHPDATVVLHVADLATPSSWFTLAQSLQHQQTAPLFAIVLNAGNTYAARETLEDGMEANFTVNVVAQYALARLLIPLLQTSPASDRPRVIFVSSGGMLTEPLELDNMQCEKDKKFDGVRAYAKNKRAQVHMAEALASQHDGVLFFSDHPGWVDTELLARGMPAFHRFAQKRLRSPEQGADVNIWLSACTQAALDREGIQSGDFVFDRKKAAKHLSLCSPPSPQIVEAMAIRLEAIFSHLRESDSSTRSIVLAHSC